MLMKRLSFNPVFPSDYVQPFSSDGSDLVDIDQSYNNKFNLNEAGWIRNDISAFELAQSESERLIFLDRLKEIDSKSSFSSFSDAMKIRLCMPRRALSDPVLYAKYVDVVSQVEYEMKKDAYDKAESERLEDDAKEAEKKAAESLSNKVDAVVQESAQSVSKPAS